LFGQGKLGGLIIYAGLPVAGGDFLSCCLSTTMS
jgi:hypothetical protein